MDNTGLELYHNIFLIMLIIYRNVLVKYIRDLWALDLLIYNIYRCAKPCKHIAIGTVTIIQDFKPSTFIPLQT